MKKGTRNNIILWSIISFVILWFALPMFQTKEFATTENPILPTESPPIIPKPIDTITETPLTTKATKNLTDRDIVYSARHVIRKCLLSASSDSFPVWPNNSYGITTLGNNTYLVSGKVAGKNVYGVKLQNTWITKLEFSGNNLETIRAIYIKIGDEVLLDVESDDL